MLFRCSALCIYTITVAACGVDPTTSPAGLDSDSTSLSAPTGTVLHDGNGTMLALQGVATLDETNAFLKEAGLTGVEAFNAGGFALISLAIDHYDQSEVGSNTDAVCEISLNNAGDASQVPEGIYWVGTPVNDNPKIVKLGRSVFGNPYKLGQINSSPEAGMPTSSEVHLDGHLLFGLYPGNSSLPTSTMALNLPQFQVTAQHRFTFTFASPSATTRPYDPSVDSFSVDQNSDCGVLLQRVGFKPFQWQQIGDATVVVNSPEN